MESNPRHNTADIVGEEKKGGAAEDYHRFMLMKEKIKLMKSTSAAPEDVAAKKILGHMSEKEVIELGILERLNDITESSPEWSQVSELTGSEDRFTMARILAESVYQKAKKEKIMSFYTQSKTDLDTTLEGYVNSGYKARTGKTAAASVSPSIWS